MKSVSDADLMRYLREGRKDMLEQLYDRYAKLVYSFARRATMDDGLSREVVQLVFTKLWTTSSEYDEKLGDFSSWLITITRRAAIDVQRRERRHQGSVPMGELEHSRTTHTEDDPEAQVLRGIHDSEIREATRQLNPAQQRVLELLYWRGYTLQEIAGMLQEPVGTVKSRLHQALRILRKQLQGIREEM